MGLTYAYRNAVLSFDGAAVIDEPAELTLQGTVPYAFPIYDGAAPHRHDRHPRHPGEREPAGTQPGNG